MSQTTVKQLAQVVGIPAERLLAQMAEAGVSKQSENDVVTDQEKQALLSHIRAGTARVSAEPSQVTLRRKSTSTLKVGAGSGGSKAVNVEVRKKRTYVHRDLTSDAEKQRQIDEVERAAREAEAAEAVRLATEA